MIFAICATLFLLFLFILLLFSAAAVFASQDAPLYVHLFVGSVSIVVVVVMAWVLLDIWRAVLK